MNIFDTIARVRHIAATIDAVDAVKSICIGSDAEADMWNDLERGIIIGGRPQRGDGLQKLCGLGINIDPLRRDVLVEFIEDSRAPLLHSTFQRHGFSTRAI